MESVESILNHIYSAQESLNEARKEIEILSLEPTQKYLMLLDMAFANISTIEKSIYIIDTRLESNALYEGPDSDLTAEQLLLVSKLTANQVEEIDLYLLKSTSNRWRKVARVVGIVMMEFPETVKSIPDAFYSQRIKRLVKLGFLESDGNLDYMRYSSVRIPDSKSS